MLDVVESCVLTGLLVLAVGFLYVDVSVFLCKLVSFHHHPQLYCRPKCSKCISCFIVPDHYCIMESYLYRTASSSTAEIHGCAGCSS